MQVPKIMIVEDNLLVAEDLKSKLTRMGHHVEATAKDGEQAIKEAETCQPDLVLMDIQLGSGITGIETAQRLQSQHELIIIYLTAYTDEDTLNQAKLTEPHGFIVKPFDEKELKSAIDIALYKKKSEQVLIESHSWLETVLKSIGDAVIASDMGGQVTFINPVAQQLTGWDEFQAVGASVKEVFQIISEQSGEFLQDPVSRIIAQGSIGGLGSHTILKSRDGRDIPISDSGAPIKNEAGEMIGVVLIFRDQTEERQTRQALEESERNLHQAQKIAKLGNWSWDSRTDAMTWSDAMFGIFQIPKQEVTFDLIKSTVHPEDMKYWMTTIERAVRNKEPFELEYRVIGPESAPIWIRNKTTVLQEGEHTVFFGTAQDVTEQKQVENELIAAKNKLIQAQQFAKIGLWEYDIKKDLITWSDEHYQIYGIGSDEGTFPMARLFELIHEDFREYHQKQFDIMLETGSAEFEYPVNRTDGKEQWVWARGMIRTDKKGVPTHAFGFTQDITKRKKTEELLRLSEERFKMAMDASQDGLFDWDLITGDIYFSPGWKRMLGYSDREIVNDLSIWEDLAHPDDIEQLKTMQAELISGRKERYEMEFRMQHKKGHWVDVFARTKTVFDENGKGIRVVGTHVDISDRKRMENELIQAQKMESIGTLAGGIAHDFNNILSSILGFSELALQQVRKNTPIEDDLNEIRSAGKRAKELVKQILSFARKSEETIKPVHFKAVLNEVLKLIRSSIPSNIEIQAHIQSEFRVMGNPTQIHQVLMNLFTNAAHAMEENGGLLRVDLIDTKFETPYIHSGEVLESGNYIQLCIEDTGKGIPDGIRQSIFEPYFTTKEKGEGTGMGLAVVHGIVQSYGGKIFVSSQEDKGTLFTVYLPSTKQASEKAHEPSGQLPTGSEHILFVDDEPAITKMGALMLEALGYTVVQSNSSSEALAWFKKDPLAFDLIISDMTMPQITGDQLAMEILKIRPDIPFIICTGYSKRINDEIAMKIGIKALLMKPIEKKELANTVRDLLEND